MAGKDRAPTMRWAGALVSDKHLIVVASANGAGTQASKSLVIRRERIGLIGYFTR
jgi:hypothetical protein